MVSAFGLAAPGAQAHEFEEARRLVLSVEGDRLALLVAYELQPGRLADGLRAQFDQGHDGAIDTPFERLARARVMAPRLGEDLELRLEGRRLPLQLEELRFLAPPRDGGRLGVAAVALYRAPAPPADGAERALRVRATRGRVTLEAQATPPRTLRAEALPRRDGDPVLGPARLGPAGQLLHLR